MREVVVVTSLAVLLTTTATTATTAQEVIGPWTIQAAPVEAIDLNGIIDPSNWLNVVNAAVTVSEAFTGFSVVADGFANLSSGTVIQVSFTAPLENVVGPELVLFDARFDSGSYAVSSVFDGFAVELEIADVEFIDSGEVRDYYYGHNPTGPFNAAVWGAEIDLTDLGLPAGATTETFRFRSTNMETDPLALGSLVVPVPVQLQSFSVE